MYTTAEKRREDRFSRERRSSSRRQSVCMRLFQERGAPEGDSLQERRRRGGLKGGPHKPPPLLRLTTLYRSASQHSTHQQERLKGLTRQDTTQEDRLRTQQLLCSCHSRSAMIFSRSSLAEERRRRQQQRRKKTAETREDCSAERHDKAAQSSGAETGAEGSSRNRRRRQQQRRAKTAAQTSAAEIASTKLEQSTHRKGTVSGICDSMACSIEASSSSFSNSIPKPLFFGGDVI